MIWTDKHLKVFNMQKSLFNYETRAMIASNESET